MMTDAHTATFERADSLVQALRGDPIDSSAHERFARASEALAWAMDGPAGHGWGASGWVHSDVAQIAANQGVLPAFLMVCALVATFVRLYRRMGRHATGEWRELGLGLLTSMMAVSAILGGEGVEVLPQMALPVWLVWVMSEIWIRQSPGGNIDYAALRDFGLAANFQFREDYPRHARVRQMGG
jgi:hypothetical protein